MASSELNRSASRVTGWIIIGLILIQFIPLDRIDHPSKPPARIPASVLAVLKSRCFDCHSGATRWPRSAYLAPLSWYVTGKVREARNAVDFSRFDTLPDSTRHKIEQSVSRLARAANLSEHAAIAGFTPVKLTEKERLILGRWESGNNRETIQTIHKSSH